MDDWELVYRHQPRWPTVLFENGVDTAMLLGGFASGMAGLAIAVRFRAPRALALIGGGAVLAYFGFGVVERVLLRLVRKPIVVEGAVREARSFQASEGGGRTIRKTRFTVGPHTLAVKADELDASQLEGRTVRVELIRKTGEVRSIRVAPP